MSCPKCGLHDVGTQVVTKGSKSVCMNIFCRNMKCNWEIDKPFRKKKNNKRYDK